MHRRAFVKYAAVGAMATASPGLLAASGAARLVADSAAPDRRFSGPDLRTWEQVLGDGIWAAPDRSPVDPSDLESRHVGTHSELRTNVSQRGVMAHNVNAKRIVGRAALDHVHVGAFDFRVPYSPAPGAWPDNAQSVEGGLFVWDGADTRRDYGLAFQWVLNPWMSSFGDIWTRTRSAGSVWGPASTLTPDREWHRAAFVLDVRNATASLIIDGVGVPATFLAEEQPDRGTETAARLQAELISLWPGGGPVAPSHRAEFRNWTWDWYAYPGVRSARAAGAGIDTGIDSGTETDIVVTDDVTGTTGTDGPADPTSGTRGRTSGGPRRVVFTADDVRRIRFERDAMTLLLTKLGWDGSLLDWIEMLTRAEGIGGHTDHLRTLVPQLFLLELADTHGGLEPGERRLFDAVNTVNRMWRVRTGRSLLGLMLG